MDTLLKNAILKPFDLLYRISPAFELSLMFRLQQGYWMDMKHPQTYNEKLQWIKLYDKNPLMTKCCDKYAVRSFVTEQGCADLLNTLLWEGFDPADIPFDTLPDKFVIKVTHGSTFNIICTDKSQLDRQDAIRKCRKWLKAKFLSCYGEWFYGKEQPRVIVEQYLESDDGEQLRDYKVFCFHGEPRYVRVDSDRFTDHRMDVFTPEWERLPNKSMGCPCSDYEFDRPECLAELLDAARKLSARFLHARVDFYLSGHRLYFGELTFTNGAGYDRFEPEGFDAEMGSWLHVENAAN